jgi:hypothetical protein
LLKLALKARTTSSRGKPISIILLIDASKALPVTKLGSAGPAGAAGVAGALESATGAASVVSVVVGGVMSTSSVFVTGAGAAGVLAGGWTGAAEVDADDDVDATGGATLICN